MASNYGGMFSGVGAGVANPYGWTARRPAVPVSAIGSAQTQAVGGYAGLAAAADTERIAQAQRAAERQAATMAGYEQQIASSAQRGDQGYQQLASNYDQIAADAAATRARNMERIDQYGNSMRQDLDIKNKQALAAAAQSAIKRGLGNTTIQDSLVRGQNFDNTRQRLSLEDQLLQNRIATDSQLSGAYQGVMQNRANSLNSQWNQNIQNDNQLAGQKLGYLGSIQENMDGFNSVANLYTQLWQMENANQQALLDRIARNPEQYQAPRTGVRLGMPRRAG